MVNKKWLWCPVQVVPWGRADVTARWGHGGSHDICGRGIPLQRMGGHSEVGTPFLAPQLPTQDEGPGPRGRVRGKPHAGTHRMECGGIMSLWEAQNTMLCREMSLWVAQNTM